MKFCVFPFPRDPNAPEVEVERWCPDPALPEDEKYAF